MDVVLKVLAQSLEWPDDIACSKAVEAAQRLLPRLQGEMQVCFHVDYVRVWGQVRVQMRVQGVL